MSCSRVLVAAAARRAPALRPSLSSSSALAHTRVYLTMAAPLPADPRTSLRQRTPAADRTHSGHSHSHAHAHGGHGHAHSHGIEETAHLSSAFQSLRNPAHLDPGSRITLVGLVANVGLTAVKGAAGYILASSALLADAAHSGSDLVADVVTLVSYRVGKWEPSTRYPYGYGKFESLGSLVVSFLLIATAAGIGLHSYHHLLLSLATIPSIPPDLLASLDFLPHGHVHGPEASDAALSGGADGAAAVAETVDARAMYFAAFSILVKEWLYRATLRVAKQQHSNVLLANAYHHRSDSLGSLVALLAIGAARVGYPMLDPIGGLVVTGMIAKQGYDVGKDALKALVDQVGDEDVQPKVYDAIRSLSSANVEPWRDEQRGKGKARLFPSSSSAHDHDHDHDHAHAHADPSPASGTLPILAIPSIRLFASGPSLLIDILLVLPPSLSLAEASHIEQAVGRRVREVVGRERVREVVVRMRADGVDNAAGGSVADGAGEGVELAHDEIAGTGAKGGKEQ